MADSGQRGICPSPSPSFAPPQPFRFRRRADVKLRHCSSRVFMSRDARKCRHVPGRFNGLPSDAHNYSRRRQTQMHNWRVSFSSFAKGANAVCESRDELLERHSAIVVILRHSLSLTSLFIASRAKRRHRPSPCPLWRISWVANNRLPRLALRSRAPKMQSEKVFKSVHFRVEVCSLRSQLYSLTKRTVLLRFVLRLAAAQQSVKESRVA